MNDHLQSGRCKRASPDVVLDPLVLYRSHQAPNTSWTHVFGLWIVFAGCGAAKGWKICLCDAFNDPEAKLLFLCSTGSSQLFIKQQCTWTNNAVSRWWWGVSALQTCCWFTGGAITLCYWSSRFISSSCGWLDGEMQASFCQDSGFWKRTTNVSSQREVIHMKLMIKKKVQDVVEML